MPTTKPLDFAGWTLAHQRRVEAQMGRVLDGLDAAPGPLRAAMRYAVLDGGKRVRPLLSYATGEAVGAAPSAVDSVAVAVELIHAYSLVHDDLPCMDNDTLRRGKPTCHVAHGEARALLVGDSLQSVAFEVLADFPGASADIRLECIRTLALAAGPAGMAGGQDSDLASTGKLLTLAGLEAMHRAKTGALIGAAVRMAALCGDVSHRDLDRLEQFASCVGLLFQVVDDVLDHEQDSFTLGKTSGKDAQQGKVTFVSLLGLARSRARAQSLEREALEALESFGTGATRLQQLCGFIASRKH